MEHLDVQRIRPPVTVAVSGPVNGHLPAPLSSVFASILFLHFFGNVKREPNKLPALLR